MKITETKLINGIPCAEGILKLIESHELKSLSEDWRYIHGEKIIKPIIVSDTEPFEVGVDKVLTLNGFITIADSFDGREYLFNEGEVGWSGNGLRKIIAMHEHFSDEQLQMIMDGRIKKDHKVYIECEKDGEYVGTHPLSGEKNSLVWDGDYKIKLTNSHISMITEIEQEEAWDKFYRDYFVKTGKRITDSSTAVHEFLEWMTNNCNPPTLKQKT